MERIEERLERVEALLSRLADEQARLSTQVAVLIERLATHAEREDIHTVPPCGPARVAIAELKDELTSTRRWMLGVLGGAIAALVGVVWSFVREHIASGRP